MAPQLLVWRTSLKTIKNYDPILDIDKNTTERVERMSKGKKRKKLKAMRQAHELQIDEDSIYENFDDYGLQEFYERGLITEVINQLKTGKEATVFLVEGPEGLFAAKIYADMMVRGFKNDRIYRERRFVADARIKKAIDQRSRTGVDAHQALWIYEEFATLNRFYNAGLPVPRPLAQEGRVILMEYIGDEVSPALRLADERLTPEEAQSAFKQSVDIMVDMLKLGRVHSDYSTFNLLWWKGQVIVIDFPQAVEIKDNPSAWMLLRRDCQTLCKSFERFQIKADAEELLEVVKQRAQLEEFNIAF